MKHKITFALLMGVVTTCVISFTLICVNVGFSHSQFLQTWIKSWAIAYMVAVPAILIISPQIQKLVELIYKTKQAN
jgi:hypothetical protein